MGLFGALNKMSGYSAENMNKVFDEFLPVMDSKAICPIGISLKSQRAFLLKADCFWICNDYKYQSFCHLYNDSHQRRCDL